MLGYKRHQQPIYRSKVSSANKFHQLCKVPGIIPCNSLHIQSKTNSLIKTEHQLEAMNALYKIVTIICTCLAISCLAEECMFVPEEIVATNGMPIISVEATGTRGFDCNPDGTVIPDTTSGNDAVLTGIAPFEGATGVLDYTTDGVAFFAIDLPAGASKTFYLTPREDPNNMAFPSPDGSLEYTRRFISMSEGDADLPNGVFMARTATTGGVPPATCPKGATQVDVPYTAVYTFYTCA